MASDALAILTRIGHAPLIGRDEERKLLASRLMSSVSPPGAVLVVSGEPGAGKTRLALEAARDAARQGARLLSLRCYQETGALPYAPFAELSDSVPEVVHVLTH